MARRQRAADVSYDAESPADANKFPALPATIAENPPRLLQALADAGEACDPDSVRYALYCLQLRGQQGAIGATDGRQLLLQSGFAFPWEGDILIPRSKVFSSPELVGDHPVLVGKAEDYIAFRVGAWTFWLAVNKYGRFPDVSRHIPRPADATARCQLSPADAEFLSQSLPRLPCDEAYNFPITLDLNGSIAIRAKAADQPRLTEVVLTGSEWSGEAIRLNMNRKFLARALKLGFRELLVYGNAVPVLCQDECRQYVWALLEPDSSIKPAADAIRIESPAAGSEIHTNPTPTKRNLPPMTEPTANTNAHALGNGHAKVNSQARKTGTHKASQQDVAALIEQAVKLRTALHDLMYQASGLVKALKAHRRQTRAVQNTLASLRNLKGLGV